MSKRRNNKLLTGPEIKDISRKVTIHRDSTTRYTPLYLEVFVVGDSFEQKAFAEMFIRAKCTRASSIERADLVVFTGGPDVNPAYYGAEPHKATHWSVGRDNDDIQAYKKCLDLGVPMFGVCRGMQFLHVMNGGRLFQDVDNHNGDHQLYDVVKQRIIPRVSSVHHQMVMPNIGMTILATTHKSEKRWLDDTSYQHGHKADIEAMFYPDTCCLGVQGHPEYRGYNQFMQWTFNLIDECIIQNTDVALEEVPGTKMKYHRLKKEVREQRTLNWEQKAKEAN